MLTGSSRRSSASTTLNTAVLAPMPIASVAIAAAVNPLLFRSCESRTAHRRASSNDPQPEALPSLLLALFDGAELDPGDPQGLFRREAAARREIFGAALEVKLQLVGHVALHLRAVDDVAAERARATTARYASCALSAVLIASAVRFQRSVSAFIRFRPAAVKL